jgi:hypothetical protein
VGIWEVVFQKTRVIKRGHELCDVVLDHDDVLRVKRRSGISIVPSWPGGQRKDRPDLLFP